jgi:hypothetical protein
MERSDGIIQPFQNSKKTRDLTVRPQNDVGEHLCRILACKELQKYAEKASQESRWLE